MYDFYSTNFAYQAPSYPSTYAYRNPEMNTSCSYRFPNYGFHTGHNGPRFPPCERVPNVARVESMRMVADNTPSKPDNYTRTLHHFPPTPPSNTHSIRGFNDEPLKKSCNVDKIIEELSDEGKMTHCVGRYKRNRFYMVYLIQTYLWISCICYLKCWFNSTLWTVNYYWSTFWNLIASSILRGFYNLCNEKIMVNTIRRCFALPLFPSTLS